MHEMEDTEMTGVGATLRTTARALSGVQVAAAIGIALVAITVGAGILKTPASPPPHGVDHITGEQAECFVRPDHSDTITVFLRNDRGSPIQAASVEVYVSDRSEQDVPQDLLFEDLNWTDRLFTRLAFRSPITLQAADSEMATSLTRGKEYAIQIEFPEGTVAPVFCRATFKNETEPEPPTEPPAPEDSDTGPDTRWAADSLAPTTRLQTAATGWQAQPQHVRVVCDDADSGCRYIQWQLFDASGNRITSRTAAGRNTSMRVGEDNNGLLELRYRGIDNAGNRETWNIQPIRIDKHRPTTRIAHADAWYSSEFTRFVNDEGQGPSGLSYCEYRVTDNGTWSKWERRSCRTVTVSVGQPLSNQCTIEGTDACQVEVRTWSRAGLSRTDAARFDIDFTAPITEIVGPGTDMVFSDDFTVAINDRSSSGFDTCAYRITDSMQGATDWLTRRCDAGFNASVGPYEICSTEGTGTCIVETRVVDNAGKASLDQAAYSINYTVSDNETVTDQNTSNSTADNTTSDNTTENTTTSDTDRYTYTLSSTVDWEQGMFDGTSVVNNTLQIGYPARKPWLASYWRFDGTTGEVKDDAGGDDGTNHDTQRGLSGIFGSNAFQFERPEEQYVALPDTTRPTGADPFTISLWFKLASPPDNTMALIGGHGLGARDYQGGVALTFIGADNRFFFDMYDTDDRSSAVYRPASWQTGAWYHVAAVWDGTSTEDGQDLWINGEKVDDDGWASIESLSWDGAQYWQVGKDNFVDDRVFNGTIDEIMIFNRSLSEQAVQTLYFNGKPFTGTYTHTIDTTATNNWTTLSVDATVPLETTVDATVEAVDSSDAVVDKDSVSLSSGTANHSLTLQNTENAQITFNGTSTDPAQTWTVQETVLYYTR